MEKDPDDLTHARELAWAHFVLHAGHRMEMFRPLLASKYVSGLGFGGAGEH
jgi:hypothetical protein